MDHLNPLERNPTSLPRLQDRCIWDVHDFQERTKRSFRSSIGSVFQERTEKIDSESFRADDELRDAFEIGVEWNFPTVRPMLFTRQLLWSRCLASLSPTFRPTKTFSLEIWSLSFPNDNAEIQASWHAMTINDDGNGSFQRKSMHAKLVEILCNFWTVKVSK